ncbi:MAG TPA: hydroxyacid dehydrogenase [Chloroflexota bacterium]
MTRPRIVSVMNDDTYGLVMSPEAAAKLASFADFDRYRGASNLDEDGLIQILRGADAALSSWGVRWTERAIRESDLKIIGHAAGTVKGLPGLVWERGIAVTHAAPVIAVAVGEMALALTLACLRHLTEHDGAFKQQGTRGDPLLAPRLLTARSLHGARVGIVGASSTGRAFRKLLRAFDGVDVRVADPHLTVDEAGDLDVRLAPLEELLAECDVVSLHCPLLPATERLMNAERLRRLKDGAVFVNTARGRLVDHQALLAELRTGRISAGLDVYLETIKDDEIPLSEYRRLKNVVITPGIAGPVGTITRRMAVFVAEEFERFFAGQPLARPVTADMLATMA